LSDAFNVDWDAIIQLNNHVSEDRVKLIWNKDIDNSKIEIDLMMFHHFCEWMKAYAVYMHWICVTISSLDCILLNQI